LGHHTYLILVYTTVLSADLVLLQFQGNNKTHVDYKAVGLSGTEHLMFGVLHGVYLARDKALSTFLKWRRVN